MLEAMLLLGVSRVLLTLLTFPQLVRLLSHPISRPRPPANAGRDIEVVHQALLRIWRTGWLRDTCFHRAIAAHIMLRRRRVVTRFHYGAATRGDQKLTGHVWLTAGAIPVVGWDQSTQYPHLFEWGN
jgi:hypothetical protein